MNWLSKIVFIGFALSGVLASSCHNRNFNIHSVEDIRAYEIIEQLSDECGFSVLIKDKYAKKIMQEPLYSLHIKHQKLPYIFKLLIDDRGLISTFSKHTLRISSLLTRTFKLNYVATRRSGVSRTDIALTGTQSVHRSDYSQDAHEASTVTGMKIVSNDSFDFWNKIEKEILALLNTPSDSFKTPAPIVNKDAGFITVSGTKEQVSRVEEYVNALMKSLHRQVLIDVKILSVTLNKSQSTGINWEQIFALQNLDIGYGKRYSKDVNGDFLHPQSAELSGGLKSHYLSLVGNISVSNIINFLKTQGDVKSVSNPKVLTLNNQPALISSGEQIYYKRTQSTTTNNTSTTTSQNEIIESVFAGVLLDITPSISDEGAIILKINPSISSVKTNTLQTNNIRSIPPDMLKKQISSVVKLKDGQKIILGGLIDTQERTVVKKIPLLGDIPLINTLFKHKNKSKIITELVIIISPHIIDFEDDEVSLKDVGYSRKMSE